MKYIAWGEDDAGIIHCTTDGGSDLVLMATGRDAAICDSVRAKFGDVNDEIASMYGVPRFWLDAMEVRESGGNPRAVNPETKPSPDDDGIGLLQITDHGLKGGHTDEQLKDPRVNVTIGARYIASIIKRYGRDFPKATAAFNAGSDRPDASSPWNLHATGSHISYEVGCLNYLRTHYAAAPPLTDADRAAIIAGIDPAAQLDVSPFSDTEPPTANDRLTPPSKPA